MNRMACILVAGVLAGASSAALGQDAVPSPPGTVAPPASQAANPKSPGAGASGAAGEIRPPANVDPGITAPPPVPSPESTTPVVPPPGSPGGDPTVQPK